MARELGPQLSELLGGVPAPTDARAYLRRVQATLQWVPREAVELAAEHFGASFMHLYEEVAFSPAFCMEERGQHVVEVCQGLACREAGSQALLERLEALTGVKRGAMSSDGELSMIAGICQGRCAIGPNVKVDGFALCGQQPGHTQALLERVQGLKPL